MFIVFLEEVLWKKKTIIFENDIFFTPLLIWLWNWLIGKWMLVRIEKQIMFKYF